MTQKTLSIIKFHIVLISVCLLLICAPIAICGQGGTGKIPVTPVKTTPSKSPKSAKKSPASSKASKTRRTNNPKDTAAATERTYWESIRASSDPQDFRAYLNKYPNGEFVDLAKNKLKNLENAKAKSENVKEGLESRNNSQSLENTSPSWQMVGVWRANVFEFGNNQEITFIVNADGTSRYFIKDTLGRTATGDGGWQYSDGVLYEKYTNGSSGKGSIKWIDSDTFEITIIDNGTPAYSGMKRLYHRVK